LVELTGTVERITYRNDDTFYTVARFMTTGERQAITITGSFASINVGEELLLKGEWMLHPNYGRQLRVALYQELPPTSQIGVERYLGSGLIKGVGPATAHRIVEYLGIDALRQISENPEVLEQIPGISRKKAQSIAKSVSEKREIEQVMVFLQGHGVSPGYAIKIFKQYGSDSINLVSANPYRLADEVYGIGFITADKIAASLGLDPLSTERLSAGIRYVLSQLANDGHVLCPKAFLVKQASEILKAPTDNVLSGVDVLLSTGEAILENRFSLDNDDLIYLTPFYIAERGVARRLADLLSGTCSLMDFEFEGDLSGVETIGGYTLAPQQKLAVQKAMQHSIVVLTGGPGTGKTTTIKAMLAILEGRGLKVALTAPTGRAAKRMSEATGRPATTIHRLLEFGVGEGDSASFARNETNPLDADAIIVDEFSMVDLLLFYNLLKAIRAGTRLVLVGDIDQLPSVGAGNVLKDIIDSNCIEVVCLTEIFRQAADSLIVTNAHRINSGSAPIMNKRDGDFFFLETEDPNEASALIVDLVSKRLPNKYGFDPFTDIQVLSPMRLRDTGVDNLNALLQNTLNPLHSGLPELSSRGISFRPGDKVMQTRNNYEKAIFNGDIGWVDSVDLENRELAVKYPDTDGDKVVIYEYAELDELVLSYAISIHKSQGSEYPVIVVPFMTQHYIMLKRKLLYTAITRAKKMVVLVGSKRALSIAIENGETDGRYTLLTKRMSFEFNNMVS
jgi:exodeoxyribonuclease V alpha subunit